MYPNSPLVSTRNHHEQSGTVPLKPFHGLDGLTQQAKVLNIQAWPLERDSGTHKKRWTEWHVPVSPALRHQDERQRQERGCQQLAHGTVETLKEEKWLPKGCPLISACMLQHTNTHSHTYLYTCNDDNNTIINITWNYFLVYIHTHSL